MPISEDEFDRCSVNEATSTMSKAELRKTHKPIMEKKRRARINQCLNEIKSLILEAMKKDPARHSKLEKADILEMAVKHLQNVQRQQLAIAMAGDPSVLRKFKTGFNECAEEVDKFIAQAENSSSGIKQRVHSHLTKCITGIEQIARLNGIAGIGTLPFLSGTSTIFGSSLPNKTTDSDIVEDQNNNPRVHLPQGIQLIPSRLPSGEIAFLVPNSRNLQCFSSMSGDTQVKIAPINLELHKRESAFISVIPSSSSSTSQECINTTKPLSPPLSPSSSANSQNEDATQQQNFCRTPSPRGFRPVNSKLQRSYQSAFASTAKTHEIELKNITYPINKYASPKKAVEPLCIITNQGERFKQAQVLNDTINCEENLRQGVKRKLDHQGLLSVASSSDYTCPSKVIKTEKDSYVGLYRNVEIIGAAQSRIVENEERASSSRMSDEVPPNENRNIETNNDMWRPW